MTLIEVFDLVCNDVCRALNDGNMARSRMAADRLRAIQSEIHSCAKDPRIEAVHYPFDDLPLHDHPFNDGNPDGKLAEGMAKMTPRGNARNRRVVEETMHEQITAKDSLR